MASISQQTFNQTNCSNDLLLCLGAEKLSLIQTGVEERVQEVFFYSTGKVCVNTNERSQVNVVVEGINWAFLSDPKVLENHILRDLCLKVVQLSDHTLKMYFSLRLVGGGASQSTPSGKFPKLNPVSTVSRGTIRLPPSNPALLSFDADSECRTLLSRLSHADPSLQFSSNEFEKFKHYYSIAKYLCDYQTKSSKFANRNDFQSVEAIRLLRNHLPSGFDRHIGNFCDYGASASVCDFAIHYAMLDHDLEAIRLLKKVGGTVFPLHTYKLCRHGITQDKQVGEVLDVLIECGGRLDQSLSKTEAAQTPLFQIISDYIEQENAVSRMLLKTISLLLEKGSDPNFGQGFDYDSTKSGPSNFEKLTMKKIKDCSEVGLWLEIVSLFFKARAKPSYRSLGHIFRVLPVILDQVQVENIQINYRKWKEVLNLILALFKEGYFFPSKLRIELIPNALTTLPEEVVIFCIEKLYDAGIPVDYQQFLKSLIAKGANVVRALLISKENLSPLFSYAITEKCDERIFTLCLQAGADPFFIPTDVYMHLPINVQKAIDFTASAQPSFQGRFQNEWDALTLDLLSQITGVIYNRVEEAGMLDTLKETVKTVIRDACVTLLFTDNKPLKQRFLCFLAETLGKKLEHNFFLNLQTRNFNVSALKEKLQEEIEMWKLQLRDTTDAMQEKLAKEKQFQEDQKQELENMRADLSSQLSRESAASDERHQLLLSEIERSRKENAELKEAVVAAGDLAARASIDANNAAWSANQASWNTRPQTYSAMY